MSQVRGRAGRARGRSKSSSGAVIRPVPSGTRDHGAGAARSGVSSRVSSSACRVAAAPARSTSSNRAPASAVERCGCVEYFSAQVEPSSPMPIEGGGPHHPLPIPLTPLRVLPGHVDEQQVRLPAAGSGQSDEQLAAPLSGARVVHQQPTISDRSPEQRGDHPQQRCGVHQPARPAVRQPLRQPSPQPPTHRVGVDHVDIGASGDDEADRGRLPGSGYAAHQQHGAVGHGRGAPGVGRGGGSSHPIQGAGSTRALRGKKL